MRFVPPILANALLLVAVIGYGSLLGPLFSRTFSRIDRIAFVLLGGLGALGTLLFLVGQVRFSRLVVLVVLVPGLVLGARFVVRVVRSTQGAFRGLTLPVLPVGISAAVFLLTLIGGLAAPTGDIKTLGIKNDSIAYHFLAPRVWLRNQIVRPIPDECLTAMPAIVETDYGALISLGGARAPDLFAAAKLLVLLLVCAGLALRLDLDIRERWWAIALIATMPVVYIGVTGGFVDAVYSGFVLAALRIALDLESQTSWILFGLFCGFAMGTKYTGIIACGLLIISALVASTAHKSSLRALSRGIAVATVVASCVAAPWYLRNWVLLGSPMYPPPPGVGHIFHVRYLPVDAIRRFHIEVWREGHGMGRDFWNFLMLPFHLTLYPADFLDGPGGIGLVPLALAPFGLLACRRDPILGAVGLFAVLQTAVWFVTEQDGRFFVHVLALLAIAGLLGWRYVAHAGTVRARILAGMVVAVSVLYGTFMIGRLQAENVHSVVSTRFEAQREQAEIPFLESFEKLNADSSVTKVLFLDPYVPAYYSGKPYIKVFGRWGEQTLPNVTTVPQVLSQLGALHVSHILDVRWPDGKFEVPENTPGLTLVFERPDQRIYRVDGTSSVFLGARPEKQETRR